MLIALFLWAHLAQAAPSFSSEVAPIFAKKCAGCHYPAAGKVKGGLDLSSAAATLAGGESGAAVIPGKAQESLLVQTIEHRVEPYMPPPAKGPKLSDAEIAVIRAWIDAGAPDDVPTTTAAPAPTAVSSATPAPITAIAYAPDGQRIARGGMQIVQLLQRSAEGATAEVVATLTGHADAVRALAFSPDGSLLAAAGGLPGRTGEVKLWRVADGVLLHTIAAHADAILGLAFSPDGKHVVTCSYDRVAKVFNVADGTELRTLSDHVDAINAVVYSADGKFIATGGSDRTVKLWDAATGERQITLSDSTDAVLCLAISPDSRYLAAGAADKRIRVWDLVESGNRFMQSGLTSGVLKQSTFAHEGAVLHLCYAPDGTVLYSTAEDKRIKAWDTATMAEKLLFEPQSDWVLGMALAPDGATLAVGRYDATSALIDTATGKAVLCAVGNVALADAAAATATATTTDADGARKKVSNVNVDLIEVQASIPPTLQSISPMRQPRGTTFEAVASGFNLAEAVPYFDDTRVGVEVVKSEALPVPEVKRDPNSLGAQIFDNAVPYRITLKITLPDDLAPGTKYLFCRTPRGLSEPAALVVLPEPELGEFEPNDTREVAQRAVWPSVIAGTMNVEGDVDRYRIAAEAGQEVVCILRDVAPNFTLTLRDTSDKTLAHSDDFGRNTEARLGYRVETAGDYIVEVSHRDLRRDLGYRLHIGPFPWVYAISPLGISMGPPQTVSVQGFNLGGATQLEVDPPDSAAPWSTMDLPVPAYANNPMPSAKISFVPFDSQAELEPNNTAAQAQPVEFRRAIDGTLHSAGKTPDEDLYRIRMQQGQAVFLEVLASRLGSPVDSVIDVLDVSGQLLQRAQARCVGQTFITLNDRDSIAAGIRIDNWSDFAINDYLLVGNEIVRVKRLPGYADEDIALYEYRGKRLGFFGTTPEFHAVNAPVYKIELRGVGETLPPNGMPVVPIYWTNDDAVFDDQPRGDSQLAFEAPADGEYLVRVRDAAGAQGPRHAYRLLLRARQPGFECYVGPYRNNLVAGGRVPIEIRVLRRDEFDAPVRVRFENVPPGFTIEETVVPGDTEDGRAALVAAPDAVSPDPGHVIKAVATATMAERTVTRESSLGTITVVPGTADIEVQVDKAELPLRPGETQTLHVRLVRNNGFNSRVPIEMLNLPFGVRVLDTGLNGILVREGELERDVRIYCEPFVQPLEQPLYVQARIEARAPGRMLFLSPTIQLRVLPIEQQEAKN